jgi:membrane protease YdiL (CAAX protease family)
MKKSLTTLLVIMTGMSFVQAQAPVANTVNLGPILSLLAGAQVLVTRLVPFLIGLAVVVFFWYLIQFIVKGGQDATAKDVSLKGMGYSILAIFVMVSIWGIIGFMASLTGIGQGGTAPTPGVPSYCDPTRPAGTAGAC